MKDFIKKYWLKIVIGFTIFVGLFLAFRFFSGNNKLKESLRELADDSREKIVKIDTTKKIKQIEIQVKLENNVKKKVLLKKNLTKIKKISDRKKRLEALIVFHKSLRNTK